MQHRSKKTLNELKAAEAKAKAKAKSSKSKSTGKSKSKGKSSKSKSSKSRSKSKSSSSKGKSKSKSRKKINSQNKNKNNSQKKIPLQKQISDIDAWRQSVNGTGQKDLATKVLFGRTDSISTRLLLRCRSVRWCICWVFSPAVQTSSESVLKHVLAIIMTRLLSQTSERFWMREQSKGKLNWKWKTWNDACKFTQFHTVWQSGLSRLVIELAGFKLPTQPRSVRTGKFAH